MLQAEAIKLISNDCENQITASPLTPLRVRNQVQLKCYEDKSDGQFVKGRIPIKLPEEFYKDLQQFHEKRSTPIMHMPKISGHEIDLHRLYSEVTERGGFQKVTIRDDWDEILPELGLKEKCVNGSAALKYIYRRVLEKYERLNFFGEDPDKMDALDAIDISEIIGRGNRPRYPSTIHNSIPTSINNVAMSYNYRQHTVNMDKRRQFKLSTDIYKASPYEKLMLSLLSPLPNEQDFAINCCTLMANESKHTLKLSEYPKVLDALLAHTGVFSDYSMRKLFEHVYSGVRHHSLYGFWCDLLHDQPHILELQTNENGLRDAGLLDETDDYRKKSKEFHDECMEFDFLNLGRGLGTQDYVGQRVLQIVSILRNLSFLEENLTILASNRTFLRFLVMSSNVRWSNIHIQALEIAGNIATEVELRDPMQEDLSRCLMDTLCEGVESDDRAVIINCLEILYKLCQRDSNEDHILKCLNLNFFQTIAQYLSLNDIMLLIFTLETIYALTSLGTKSCHMMMQVKGIIDQLISLITVEAQSYGPDGCILMRVIETIPGNMLPLVAQNMGNVQSTTTTGQSQSVLPSFQQSSPLVQNPVQMKPQVIVAATPTLHIPQPENVVQESNATNITSGINSSEPCSTVPSSATFTQDDEQYALSWLGSTFERVSGIDNRIEQQELYRMYFSHCQNSGKQSAVNQVQFPRLVRLIFTNNVGPVIVNHADGTEMAGFHYVGMRMKAQAVVQQTKTTTSPVGNGSKPMDTLSGVRKIKKKSQITTIPTTTITLSGSSSSDIFKSEAAHSYTSSSSSEIASGQGNAAPITKQQVLVNSGDENVRFDDKTHTDAESERIEMSCSANVTSELSHPSTELPAPLLQQQQQQTPSALVKSLLANKVNQRQQKQKDLNIVNSPVSAVTSAASETITNISTSGNVSTSPQPIKVTSTAISALVNNPLLQNTPVKVGQTTIKPLNPHLTIEKKSSTDSTPPPLAPLSGNNVTKDGNGRPIILSNQVLVDIFDKKNIDASMNSSLVKRKQDDVDASSKRQAFDARCSRDDAQAVTPSKNAANLYAEMAASILEDEDLDDIPPVAQTLPTQLAMEPAQPMQTSLLMPKVQTQTPTPASSLQAVPRQIVFQTNQSSQIKLAPANSNQHTQQLPNVMATIKTDQGLQTVPVILQQKPMDPNQPTAQLFQQVIQQASSPQQTQYILATNPQGQTYLVAQPAPVAAQAPTPPPPTQTVLVTQTPQQQSTGTKTIIILQQQTLPPSSTQQQQHQQIITNTTASSGQKVIMTTAQGQQVLVTQRPQTPQQIFINPQTGTATHIHVPLNTGQPTNLMPRQIMQTSQHMQQPQQIAAGQISPSLLNQLNQIPATIKLHQPVAVQSQQAAPAPQPTTISRISKNVSLVQAGVNSSSPSTPVPIPQLQQHQSIIQQHIISGGNVPEKRHVLLGGGRAIEIKETVITQAQPPPQQCQLNSQTIITTQPPPAPTPPKASTPPQLQQQVQQQLRSVIEQQQQHPSIIQQKISVPLVQATTNTSMPGTPILLAPKLNEPATGMVQTKSITQSPLAGQNPSGTINSQTIMKRSSLSGTTSSSPSSIIKPALPLVKIAPNTSNGPPPLAPATLNSKQVAIAQQQTPQKGHQLQQQQQQQHQQQQHLEYIKRDEKEGHTKVNITSATVHTTTMKSGDCGNNAANERQQTTIVATFTESNNSSSTTTAAPTTQTSSMQLQQQSQNTPATMGQQQQQQIVPQLSAADAQWLYICDWRNCPRHKYKTLNDLQHHVCTAHAPDHLDSVAEIFCQWGIGPGLCDGLPRKKFALMTHLIERHLTPGSLKAAVQRRIATGMHNINPSKPPVTIIRNLDQSQKANTPAITTFPINSPPYSIPVLVGPTALHAIRRHTTDSLIAKELMDENEGPVTKSIRLTAALILRNLVTYTSVAKRSVRRYESHLANIALSNVEASGIISTILYELNN